MDYLKLLKQARSQLPEEVLHHERFEIPEIKSLIIGNKTEIVNFTGAVDIINRDADQVIKYLNKELATSAELSGGKLILNGKFGNMIINDKFKKFVSTFVLCLECKKPDTKIIKDGRDYFLKCNACGARRYIKKLK